MRPQAVIIASIVLITSTTARAGAQSTTSARITGRGQDATAFVDALASRHYLLREKPLGIGPVRGCRALTRRFARCGNSNTGWGHTHGWSLTGAMFGCSDHTRYRA